MYGHTGVVQLLLDEGADVHARGDGAIQIACDGGHVGCYDVLLAAMGSDERQGDVAELVGPFSGGPDPPQKRVC